MAKNLAILVWFTQRLCDRAGVEFDALEQCKALLVPSADDLESGRSSLDDFIEYMRVLRSDGRIGEHVAVSTTRREDGKRFVAIYTQAIWEDIQNRFNPNFGLPGLKTLVQESGGYQGTAKFVRDRLAWDGYLRDLDAYNRNPHVEGVHAPKKPSKEATRKALFIPIELFEEEVTNQVTEVTESNQNAVTSRMLENQGLQTTTTTSNQSNQKNIYTYAQESSSSCYAKALLNSGVSYKGMCNSVTPVFSVTSDSNQDTAKISEVTTSSYSPVTNGHSPVTSPQLDAIAPGMRVWWGLDAVLWVVESVEGDCAHIRTLKGDRPPAPVPLSELRKVAA